MFPYTEVPQQMKDSATWVAWKYERDAKGKPTKPPSNVRTNGKTHASTTDPDTWVPFAQAVEATDPLNGSDYEGPGFVFKMDFQGSDLDGVVQAVNGSQVISPFGLAVAKVVNSYVEFSPSRTGLHIIWESPIPLPKEGRKKGNHNLGGEIYDKDSPRFFTVTGDKVPGISTDSITRITDPNRIKLIHFLVLNIINERFTRLWTGAWQKTVDAHGKPFPSQSEADLSLCHILVQGGFNTTETLDAAFRQSGLMRDEWEHKSKYTIAKALSGEKSDSSTAASDTELVFTLPAVETTEANDGDCILARILDQSDDCDEGWIPRGSVSLIGGPSGSGKTTTMYQLLLAQACKGKFLGHDSFGLSFCVMGVDRGLASHRRTMKRMRMRPETISFDGLALSFDFDAVQQVIVKIEAYAAKHKALPAIVLLEGVDIMVTKVNDIICVSKFVNLLTQVARRYHIAILGTLGSPKIKIGQGYACMRDNVLGSGGWARECETMIVMQFPTGSKAVTKGKRVMTVMPRNAADEFFTLGFNHGQLEQVPDITEDESEDPSIEVDWFQTQHRLAQRDPNKQWFTVTDMQRALKMPYATAARHIAEVHLPKRHLRQRPGKQYKAKQYQWNTTKSNPLLRDQWAQDAVDTKEQMEVFS